MKRLNALKKFGKQAAATVTVAVLSVPAMAAEGGAADPFSAIDLSGVATKIGAAGSALLWLTNPSLLLSVL